MFRLFLSSRLSTRAILSTHHHLSSHTSSIRTFSSASSLSRHFPRSFSSSPADDDPKAALERRKAEVRALHKIRIAEMEAKKKAEEDAANGKTAEPTKSPESDKSTGDSASSASVSPAAPQRPRRSFFETVSSEIRFAKEYLNKDKKLVTTKHSRRRSHEEILADSAALLKHQKLKEHNRKHGIKSDEEKKIDENVSEEFMAPVLVDTDTVWDKRINSFKDSIRNSSLFRGSRSVARSVAASPVAAPLVAVKDKLAEELDDMKYTWEETQHPWAVRSREIAEKVVGETETGFAVGEILKVDPSFNLIQFQEYLEEFMIPIVLTSFLRGSPQDYELLDTVTESQARHVIFASKRERETLGVYWDHQILDIAHIEMQKAVIIEETPYIVLSFAAQQINHVRERKSNKTTDGNESDIKQVFYYLVLRRDLEHPDFDWKICEMQFHKIYALV